MVTMGASRHASGTAEPDETTTPRPSAAGPGTGMPPNLRGGCHRTPGCGPRRDRPLLRRCCRRALEAGGGTRRRRRSGVSRLGPDRGRTCDQDPDQDACDGVVILAHVPDAIFDDPRLAQVYDPLDPDRSDLDAYAAIVDELGARSVLDIGCGTGTFACPLARRGIEVTGVDPAAASLDVARGKPGADAVRWVHGDATTLPALQVDAAFMTANVAQVFLTDEAWDATL